MMTRLCSLFFILIISITTFAQSAENRYNSRLTRDGMLFFIMPMQLRDLSGLKKFEYDVTLLSWTDSATVNFTFESSSMLVPTDLKIGYDKGFVECNSYYPLFIDIKKNHYEIRITSKISNTDFESILRSSTPPQYIFNQGSESKIATYKHRVWNRDQKKLVNIYQLYQYSK